MPKYSTIDEGLNSNHNRIERISYLFAILCFFLSFLLKRWFIYGDVIVTLTLLLIFSIVCFRVRMSYVRNINRWFYARFHNKKFTIVFLISLFSLIISLYVFFILLFSDFFITSLGGALSDGIIYRRITHFLLNDVFLGAIISNIILFYIVIFIEEYIMIFIVFLKVCAFRDKAINDIMSYSNCYLQEELKHERRR